MRKVGKTKICPHQAVFRSVLVSGEDDDDDNNGNDVLVMVAIGLGNRKHVD